jgi:hypothetical protein
MSGKLLSLFTHPEFVRRSQARAERELAERVVPVIDLGRGRYRCRRCSLDFDTGPKLQLAGNPSVPAPCPECDSAPDFDTVEAFLGELLDEQ